MSNSKLELTNNTLALADVFSGYCKYTYQEESLKCKIMMVFSKMTCAKVIGTNLLKNKTLYFNTKNDFRIVFFARLLFMLFAVQFSYCQVDILNPTTSMEYASHFLGEKIDVFSVEANSAHVHKVEYNNNDLHQFQLVSVFPLTEGGRVTYQTDVIRTSESPFVHRRLAVINKSDFSVAFKLNIKKLSIKEFEHTEVLNESSSVAARGTLGFHFERTDKHAYYLVSIYPTRTNARLMFEWDNVKDPGSSGFIRRLNVINKSNFIGEFEIKVIKIDAETAANIGFKKTGLLKSEKLNKTSTVKANSQHGFHFERTNKHAFYLTSLYPLTENGRLTYEWDNVRDPGSSGFIRRLNVINKSNKPVEFKVRVSEVKPVKGVLDQFSGNSQVNEVKKLLMALTIHQT
ncbi:hypothetical protein [Lacinutrix himadriensis]|uniref:hypothetical protein n=1 Tax=Lacinutrix himadriensis TaxID=641549 RepID=UPI0006E1F2A9|nr:hypothetical protein [Lacinutrix himadriensis]